jgi:hypothetical protein
MAPRSPDTALNSSTRGWVPGGAQNATSVEGPLLAALYALDGRPRRPEDAMSLVLEALRRIEAG